MNPEQYLCRIEMILAVIEKRISVKDFAEARRRLTDKDGQRLRALLSEINTLSTQL